MREEEQEIQLLLTLRPMQRPTWFDYKAQAKHDYLNVNDVLRTDNRVQ